MRDKRNEDWLMWFYRGVDEKLPLGIIDRHHQLPVPLNANQPIQIYTIFWCHCFILNIFLCIFFCVLSRILFSWELPSSDEISLKRINSQSWHWTLVDPATSGHVPFMCADSEINVIIINNVTLKPIRSRWHKILDSNSLLSDAIIITFCISLWSWQNS